MPLLERFDPPANINDFEDAGLRQLWSDKIAAFFQDNIDFLVQRGVTPQFYSPLVTETTEPSVAQLIDWTGFPKLVKDAFPGDAERAWRTAEPTADNPGRRARFQDEYLEWSVVRNDVGKITRVSFTCEGPEYWEFLAERAPETLLRLYRELVDPAFSEQVQLDDLIDANGNYNPRNQWNVLHGAVHLTHRANSLGAEVNIAASATLLRERNGEPIEDPDELTACGQFGAPGRASDPRIGSVVQSLAQDGFSITLQNPVGLYITGFSSQGWRKPDGSDVGNYWKIVRGQDRSSPNAPASVLHLVYEVPADEGFVVGDIQINNRPIEFGGQLAEFIRVGLTGIACREGQSQNSTNPCEGVSPVAEPEAIFTLHESLRVEEATRRQASQRPSRALLPWPDEE